MLTDAGAARLARCVRLEQLDLSFCPLLTDASVRFYPRINALSFLRAQAAERNDTTFSEAPVPPLPGSALNPVQGLVTSLHPQSSYLPDHPLFLITYPEHGPVYGGV